MEETPKDMSSETEGTRRPRKTGFRRPFAFKNGSERDPRPDSRSDSRGESRSDSRSDIRVDLQTEPRPDSRSDSRGESRSDSRSDIRVDLQTEPRPDSRSDSHPDSRADSRPGSGPRRSPRSEAASSERRRSSRRSRSGRGGGNGSGSGGGSRFSLVDGTGFFDSEATLGRSSRDVWLLMALFVVALVLFIRLFFLQVVYAEEYSSQSETRRTTYEVIYAMRGTIYDRNGNILATSVEATTIYANPEEITDPEATAAEIAAITGEDASTYIEALSKEGTFSYVIRKADISVAEALQERYYEIEDELGTETETTGLNALDGIYYLEDVKRVYPYGQIAGQVIGYVGTDGEGLSGLELQYDDILGGTDGYRVVEYGRGGIPIPGGVQEDEPAVDGQDIMISIDITLQQNAEEILVKYAEQSGAEGGEITIIDGATGEIYATASLPLYDLNNVSEAEEGASTLKTVSGTYEPGSIFKSVTAAILIESGVVSLDEYIQVPGSLQVANGVTITDSHEHGTLTMNLADIIAESSNIGVTLLEQRLESEDFYNALVELGFGQNTGVDYPGELSGILSSYESWTSDKESNISFGQGITVTSMQMASFYATVANDGEYVQPHFLIGYPGTDETVEYESAQLISAGTCDALEEMLCGVVTGGTGTAAAIDGYDVAGKTGTSQKLTSEGTYSNSSYIIDFAGFLANSSSKLACVVAFDDPATSCATSAFAEIMEVAANLYAITSY